MAGVPAPPTHLTAAKGGQGPTVAAVQSYINPTFLTSHTTAAFDSTGGDLIVICASSHAGVIFTPRDSFGNKWIPIAGPTNTALGFNLRTEVWYAAHPIVGPGHTFTMGLSTAQSLVISILVVKGSNVSSPIDAVSSIGSNEGGLIVNVSSPNITTTSPNDLLIGFAKTSISAVFEPGPGFTPQAAASSDFLDAETEAAAIPGSYNATLALKRPQSWRAAVLEATSLTFFDADAGAQASGSHNPTSNVNQPQTWQAVAVAVAKNPNQASLSWTASSESGGTISNYLVERCQGAACTRFVQIGATTGTTFNDTGLTASTSYSYRVRAQDTANTMGPYSNVATFATPAPPASPGNLTATGSSTQ
jgi:hypothetical protein